MTSSNQPAIANGAARVPQKKSRRLLIVAIAAVGALYFGRTSYLGTIHHWSDLREVMNSGEITKVEKTRQGFLVSLREQNQVKAILVRDTDPVDRYFKPKILAAATQAGASIRYDLSVPAAGAQNSDETEQEE
ncbi:MAG: hypothetical protein F8N36_14280 [Desulfovibrio sp.]|uniref:hypothetical protein n=1 Tax=Desulfovibrio sp. TaxID=885 RepID=UPI00135E5E11|nr:hypothetical protein [Desulfovibrio sp.]MTJ94006.1 hypothetical protein [Desulfovibrio sp.]